MYTIILTKYSTDDKSYPRIIKSIKTTAKNQIDIMRVILEISRTNNEVFNTIKSTELAEKFLKKHGVDTFPTSESDLFNDFCAYLETSPAKFIGEIQSSDYNPIFTIEDGHRNEYFQNFVNLACNQFIHDELYRGIVPDNVAEWHYL